jgi:hypothetical protein
VTLALRGYIPLPPHAVRRQCLYVAIGRPGGIDVVDCQRMTIGERMTTEAAAHTTPFDARRQQLYVFLPGTCRAAVSQETHDG